MGRSLNLDVNESGVWKQNLKKHGVRCGFDLSNSYREKCVGCSEHGNK